MYKKVMRRQRGFTLIELAIVLVIIGLILGMVFKGRQLIDSAKVKSTAAQYNKILAAINIFYDRYGFFPGDGCLADETDPGNCTGTKDGILTSDDETSAFWTLLIDGTGILSRADRRSVFGQDWQIWYGTAHGLTADWLDLPGGNQMDVRILCALDKMIDDGEYNTGDVRSNRVYHDDDNCWGMSGQADGWIKILP